MFIPEKLLRYLTVKEYIYVGLLQIERLFTRKPSLNEFSTKNSQIILALALDYRRVGVTAPVRAYLVVSGEDDNNIW